MLEKGSYVPWSSRFLRYIDGIKDCGMMLKESILKGPYQMHTIRDLGNTTIEPHERMQTEADLTGEEKKQFEADIDTMNAILLGIPNDIYNYVDACKTANAMWTSVRRLMQGTNLSKQETDSRLSNEFDKFCSSSREYLESYYERFSKLMNDIERNDVLPIPITINNFLTYYNRNGVTYVKDGRIDVQSKNVGNIGYGGRNTRKIARSLGNTAFVPKATRNIVVYDSTFNFFDDTFSKLDHEQSYLEQLKSIKPKYDNDQIDSDIIFDDLNGVVNSDQVKHDTNDHDQQCADIILPR
ncbi:hypothetical protein Tco_0318415 [Tanacetum coccineum]